MKQGDDYVLIPENEKATEFLFLNGEPVTKTKLYIIGIVFLSDSILSFYSKIHKKTLPQETLIMLKNLIGKNVSKK